MKLYKHRSKSTRIMNELITRLIVNRQICLLLLIVWATMSISASAYTMPADRLMQLSNQQLFDKAQAHWDKIQLDSALICYSVIANRAEKRQTVNDMKYAAGAYVAMANIYLPNFFDYERAMQCILKAEQIALKYDYILADIYELKAAIDYEKNCILQGFAFYPQSFEMFRKSFSYSMQRKRCQTITVLAIINMTTTALEFHKLDLIRDELKAFQNMVLNDTVRFLNFARHQNAAALHVLNLQHDSALNELTQIKDCLDIPVQSRPTFRMIAHENLFFVYRDMKNEQAALHELDLMEQIANEQGTIISIIEVLWLKREFYATMGNAAMAEKYDLLYHKAKDQFMAEAKVAKADEEKVLFRLNEANHEIKELSYKQRIQQTELIAVAVVAILLLALLVLAWLNHRRTKEKNRSLYLQNQQLLANADRMRQMRQEQERQAQEALGTFTPAVKYGRGRMEGDEIAQVMLKVERVMDESEEIYSAGFSLDRLAELAGETESRVSQAINTSGRKFYELLNEYRVREACRRMDDKATYGGLTIEAIGQSVGFKNRSHFVTTFKRLTGLSPSAYFKQPSKTEEANQDKST